MLTIEQCGVTWNELEREGTLVTTGRPIAFRSEAVAILHPCDVCDTRSDSLKPPPPAQETSHGQEPPPNERWPERSNRFAFSVRAHVRTNNELDPDPSLVGTRGE